MYTTGWWKMLIISHGSSRNSLVLNIELSIKNCASFGLNIKSIFHWVNSHSEDFLHVINGKTSLSFRWEFGGILRTAASLAGESYQKASERQVSLAPYVGLWMSWSNYKDSHRQVKGSINTVSDVCLNLLLSAISFHTDLQSAIGKKLGIRVMFYI